MTIPSNRRFNHNFSLKIDWAGADLVSKSVEIGPGTELAVWEQRDVHARFKQKLTEKDKFSQIK